MSTATDILNAVATALQGISGLSDRVVRGYPSDGPSPPVVWMAADQITSEPGPDLTGTSRTLTISIWGSPAADGSTHAIREDACFSLMDSIVAAVESSAAVLALLIAPPTCAARADVQGSGGPGVPIVVCVVECRYLEAYGSGV